jgi:hypothetical protein
MNNPEAVYDALYIGNKLQRKIEDFSQYEIQFFSYFSCLLSLYDGNSVDNWKYNFIRTELGSPYSSDIKMALATLKGNGSLNETIDSKGYFTITEKGSNFLKFLEENITTYSWRTKYLRTACNSLSLIPYGVIKEAINNEPVLSSAENSLTRRNLLLETNPATRALYSEFKELKAALEDKHYDLIVPATVWLESLKQKEISN